MNSPEPYDASVEARAAEWLARCDRGLTGAEQDSYLAWLQADPRHAQAIAALKSTWSRLDRLDQIRPKMNAEADPDLLVAAPAPSRRRSARAIAIPVALAALLVVGWMAWTWRPVKEATGVEVVRELPGPERIALPDGSTLEVNAGARFESRFTEQERRVVLAQGEAFFTVATEKARPFLVETPRLTVRAVGTAFGVGTDRETVSVVVTEGVVSVAASSPADRGGAPETPRTLVPRLIAGERALAQAGAGSTLTVQELSAAEIDAALAWRGPRFEFDACPLREAVAAFNRVHDRELVIADHELDSLTIGGTVRADQLDAFVRLLEAGFGIESQDQGRVIVLRRVRPVP